MQSQVIRIHRSLAEDMCAAVSGFLTFCQSKNLSTNTLTYYRHRLEAFQRFCNVECPGVAPKDITPQIVRQFLIQECRDKSAATASHAFIALRAFFNFLVRDGFLDGSPMSSVEKPRRRRTVIDTFTEAQVEAILATCGKDFVGVRDRAIIMLLLDCGLRATELCTLTLEDVSWSGQTLLVIGKGNVERVVPFGHCARQALSRYVDRRGVMEAKTLFVSVYGQTLTRHRIREIVINRCAGAKITGVRCSPHTFRHTSAVWFLRNGGDVFALQKLLGHSDLTMTRRYAELSQADVTAKHRRYSPMDNMGSEPGAVSRRRVR